MLLIFMMYWIFLQSTVQPNGMRSTYLWVSTDKYLVLNAVTIEIK